MPSQQIVLPWVDNDPKVKEWVLRLAKNSKSTAYGYASRLFVYWRTTLSKKYKSVEDWVNSVKEQRKSDDYEVQTKWVTIWISFPPPPLFLTPSRSLSVSDGFLSEENRISARTGPSNLPTHFLFELALGFVFLAGRQGKSALLLL